MAVALVASVAMCCRGVLKKLLLLVDGHRPYPGAILQVFGLVMHGRRHRRRGRRKLPRLKPPPGLMVGVVKKLRDAVGNLLGVKTQALFGGRRRIVRLIRSLGIGQQINTAHMERLNGTLRGQQQARMGRRTRNGSKRPELLEGCLWLWRDWYNWIRPHASLEGRTPAMAIGLTSAVWTVPRYLLQPVHAADWRREIWEEERKMWITSALKSQKPRQSLPSS